MTLFVCLVHSLIEINERGSWTTDIDALKANTKDVYNDDNYKTKLEKQDYEIFQTARLINSLTYANVVLSDFLAGILGSQRSVLIPGSSLSVRPKIPDAHPRLVQ